MQKLKSAIVLLFVVLLLQPPAVFAQELADGTLIMSEDGADVYLIEYGLKRRIESEEAFVAQGFRWSDVQTVSSRDVRNYPDGETITADSFIVLPGEEAVLPDLAPLAGKDIHISTVNGRTVLRFTTMFWNKGGGALELFANPPASGDSEEVYLDTYQHIAEADGTTRDKIVGNFLWHDLHGHYHYDHFADYVLELVRPASGDLSNLGVAITNKTTFCMRDDVSIAEPVMGTRQGRTFSTCGKYRQGVSIGWADRYGYDLPDQYIDVHDLPAGVYALSFVVDPLRRFVETSTSNNTSIALLDINPAARTVSVLASGAPYDTPDNNFPDGMLIKAEGDSRVYVMHNDKKRWIQTEAIFTSYGFSWANIYELPAGVVNALPYDNLIRVSTTSTIYALNPDGYRRRILNPTVLASYGFDDGDVGEINQFEFARYQETDLVMLAGETGVYSIGSKSYVGEFDTIVGLGYDPTSVHVINATDFSAYAVSTVAEGLDVPWDIAFLPDGDMLVTERSGTLQRIGIHPTIIDIPDVSEVGEGGLMGIALHPDFGTNSLVYLYYTSIDGSNRVTRFRLDGDTLTEDKVIIENIPSAIYHDGGQIEFGSDGMLYLTTGDASTPELAQNLASLGGKTLRLTPDGDIPSDNPFGTAVWTYGHRNAQGIAWDDQGRLWETEHGRSGALSGYDELNLIVEGANYGWPDSQGDTVLSGTVGPKRHSGASSTWAPSGIAFESGKLYFAGLRGESLYEAGVGADGSITSFEAHLTGTYGRLRAVVLGPDGFLYITTSNQDGRGSPRAGDDKVLRVHQDFLR